jgi:hypothetical protein
VGEPARVRSGEPLRCQDVVAHALFADEGVFGGGPLGGVGVEVFR